MDVPGDSGVLPGAGFSFQDVTDIFGNAAAGMSPEPTMFGITSCREKKWNPVTSFLWKILLYTMQWGRSR